MDFLINAFRKSLESYHYKFSLIKNKNGNWTLEFRDLPSDLDYNLIRLKYEGNSIRITKREGRFQHNEQKAQYFYIFEPSVCDDVNILTAVFKEDDYAVKINTIDYYLRNYITNNLF